MLYSTRPETNTENPRKRPWLLPGVAHIFLRIVTIADVVAWNYYTSVEMEAERVDSTSAGLCCIFAYRRLFSAHFGCCKPLIFFDTSNDVVNKEDLMKALVITLVLALSLMLFACGEPAQDADNADAAEVTEDVDATEANADVEEVEEVEEVEVVEEGWPTTALPEPWPQDFMVLAGLENVVQSDEEGVLVYTGNYPDDNKPGVFDSYDYYYAGFPGWEVPEGMSMSCMSDGSSLTVHLGGEAGTVVVSGDYIDGLFTMTFTLTPPVAE